MTHAARVIAAIAVLATLSLGGAPARAQAPARVPAVTEMDMGPMQGGRAPPDARDPHAYAEGASFTRGDERTELADAARFGSVLVDNFEAMRDGGETSMPYDVEAWFGKTYDRLVLKAEGEIAHGEIAEGRTEALWGHAFAAYWDAQLGLRYDNGPGPNRSWLAFGIEGLAPYWFELEITGYLGQSGRTALRVDASYDLRLTQKLILQPRLEAEFYGKRDVERGLGSGLAEVAAALRLRYEFRRELAPYLGIEWVKSHGDTADFMRAAGRDPQDSRLVAGLRFWF